MNAIAVLLAGSTLPVLDLVGPFVAGGAAGSVEVTDAPPSVTVRVLHGISPGLACPPPLGGDCVDLNNAKVLLSGPSDPAGTVLFSLAIPATVSASEICMQALVPDGPAWLTSDVQCAPIETLFAASGPAIVEGPSPPAFGAGTGHALGFTFTTSETITVTDLGVWGGGIGAPIPVGIYDAGGALLASADVLPTDPALESYRYTAVSALELPAGEYSVIAAFRSGVNYFSWSDTGSPTYAPQVAFDRMQASESGTWAELPADLPENPNSWSDQYLAANFLFTVGP